MSTINSVHHFNFVVRDLERSTQRFSRILNQEPKYDSLAGRQVKTARFQLSGVWLVLVQPTTNNSEVARILAERGEGLFLLSFGVDSLDTEVNELESRGITMDESGAREGLLDWKVWDLATEEGLGSVIQLCESSNHSIK